MELAYPITHPAHPNFKPVRFTVPSAEYSTDFLEGHPAYGGANLGELDTPDGMRAAHNRQTQNLHELAAVGSLPALYDEEKHEHVTLTPAQLAYVYAVRKGLTPEAAESVTREYQLDPMPAAVDHTGLAGPTPEEQAKVFLTALGYTPERAQELIDKYGAPDTLEEAGKQS